MESMQVCAGGVPVRPLPNPRLLCEDSLAFSVYIHSVIYIYERDSITKCKHVLHWKRFTQNFRP